MVARGKPVRWPFSDMESAAPGPRAIAAKARSRQIGRIVSAPMRH